MSIHKCFGNYMPGKDCQACIEQRECIASQKKKSPGRPPKKKKESTGAESTTSGSTSGGNASESML